MFSLAPNAKQQNAQRVRRNWRDHKFIMLYRVLCSSIQLQKIHLNAFTA